MSLAFVTMVWGDHWLLRKWVAHNATMAPRRHLHVLNHGGDPEIDRIAEGCNVIHIPRERVTRDLTRRRWDLLAGLANGLLAFHDHVVVSDVDELLLYDGTAPSLAAHLAGHTGEDAAIGAIGLNLLPGDGAEASNGVLAAAPGGVVSAKYSKPCIARRPLRYSVGGHGLIGGAFRVDPALVLCHLHFVTPDYTARMVARQALVAQAGPGDGTEPEAARKRYWINWSDPDMVYRKTLRRYRAAREVDVSHGFGPVADRLNARRVQPGWRMMIDPRLDDDDPMRVTLPAALRGAF